VDALRPDDRTRDDACVHWLPLGPDDAVTPNMIDGMQAFIQNRGLTALISGSRLAMTCVDQLMAARRLHVPHDLSIVSFEQERGPSRWAGALRPTWVDLALPEIGCRVAHLARNLADKRAVPDKTVVPCCLREGDSVGCP
jgi:DNA-binding LacI/PurR family transcriptional regulator